MTDWWQNDPEVKSDNWWQNDPAVPKGEYAPGSEEAEYLKMVNPQTRLQEAAGGTGIGVLKTLADVVSAPYNLTQQAATGEFQPRTIGSMPVGGGSVAVGRAVGRMTPEIARGLDEALLARGVPQPAGRAVAAEEAGAALRPKIEASPIPVPGLSGAESNAAITERIRSLATSTNQKDISVLHRMRGSVPPEEWAKVQTGVLGNTSDEIVRNYGSLSSMGKKALFPNQEVMKHVDDFFDVASRAPKWAELEASRRAPSGIESILRKGTSWPAIAGAAVISPLHALGMVGGKVIVNRMFAEPPVAAAAARWARQYEGFIRRPTPSTLAGFHIATRNLNSTLGEDIPFEEYLKAAGATVNIPGYTKALANPQGFPGADRQEVRPGQPTNEAPDEDALARSRGRMLGMGIF